MSFKSVMLSRSLLPAVLVAAALSGCGSKDVPEQCLDDAFEPNHSQDQAAALPTSTGPYEGTELYLCRGDQDWYAIEASAGQAIDASIDFIQADGDLDMELYTASYGLVASSVSNADGENVRYVVSSDGTFFLHVMGHDASSTNTYGMTVAVDGDACNADPLEPNDSPVQPATLPEGTTNDLTMCAFEEDWYTVHADQGQVLNFRADFDPSLYDLDMALFTANPLVEIARSDSTGDIEQIVRRAAQSEDYLLRVRSSPEDPAAKYSMDLQISGDACATDTTEPNDSYLSATHVSATTMYTGMELCYGDQDWYEFDLANGQALTAELNFDSASYDLGINVYQVNTDGTLTYRAGSDNLSGNEVASFRPWEDGTYVAYIYGSRGTVAGHYDLNLDITGDSCSPDKYETNDTYIGAPLIGADTFDGLTLCVGDQDWYTFDVAAGQVIDIQMDYNATTEADLGVQLFELNSDNTITGRAGSDLIGAPEAIVYRPYQDGTYVMQVYRSRGTNVADYGFDLNISGQACAQDAFEPNNNQVDGANIASGSKQNATMCVGDVDWYQINASAGQIITADIQFDETKEDLGVAIYQLNADNTIVWRAGSDALNSDEVVQFQPFDTGTYLVYVYRSRGTEIASYSITTTVSGAVCSDDSFEPNNLPNSPVPITPGVRNGLTLCVADQDFYKLHVENGQLLDVALDFDQTKADLSLYIYQLNADGTYITRAAVDTIDSDERLQYRPFDAGDFMVAVYRSRGTTVATYDMNVQVLGAACLDDAQEPNNSQFESAPLIPGSYPDRTLCVGDADYYELDLKNGETLDVDVLFLQKDADLGVQLYRQFPDGTIAGRTGVDDVTDNESFSYTPYEDGKFLLYVYRSRGTEVAQYDLIVDVNGSTCPADVEEPNNALWETSKPVFSGPVDNRMATMNGRHMCASDVDYYEFDIGYNQLANIDLRFNGVESDLGMTLYKKNADGSYSGRVGQNSLANEEFISYRPADTGTNTYVLQVYRANAGSVVGPAYDLSVNVAGRACVNDAYETNEHWLTAKPMALNATPTTVNNLTSCVNDVDWYDLGTMPAWTGVGKVITLRENVAAVTDGDMWLGLYRLNADNSVTNVAAVDGIDVLQESIVYTTTAADAGRKMMIYTYKARGPSIGFYTITASMP